MAKHEKIGPFRVRYNNARDKWFIDVPPYLSETGKRHRPHFNTKAEAVLDARQRSSAFLVSKRSSTTLDRPGSRAVGLTLHEASIQWVEREKQRVRLGKKRTSTLEKNIYQLTALTEFMGHQDLGIINEARLEAYQLHRQSQSRSPATINDEIGTLKSLFKWAKAAGIIDQAPTVETLRAPVRALQLPTLDEMTRVFEAISPNRRAALLLMIETGCRRSEALCLPWRHVDELHGTVTFEKFGEWDTKTTPSVRTVPVSETLLGEIRKLEKTSVYVFPGKDNDRPLGNFQKSLNSAVAEAGISRNGQPLHITPQIIRKAVITWHVEWGTPEAVTQALCGHSRGSRTTQRFYTHIGPETLRNAVISIGSQERKRTARVATDGNNTADVAKENKK